ncbi:MAG: hypothetical protein K5842_01735 [Bacteroidales bacterium]|nr:hypothetical protein [Bacteroidales bacterium]
MKHLYKKKIVYISFLLLLLSLSYQSMSQVSGIDKMLLPNYFSESTLVRNFEGKNNIIMSYGCDPDQYNVYGICEKSSFFVQATDNGMITHIVDLPFGYKVNDMQFVYLKKKQSDFYEPYLCFCGTRTKSIEYEYPHSLDSTLQPVAVPVLVGFVGYFKVYAAMSPSTADSVVVRDVECSKELHRMTCYAEQNGVFSPQQSTFRDNAVLDIIGIAGPCINRLNHNNLSSLWRVKFYPEYPYYLYPSGTHWDNNIRFNEDNVEKMVDIVGTDDYVVTVSQPENSDRDFWLRYSNKETYFCDGGLELNSNVQDVPLSTLQINGINIQNSNLTTYDLPVRLSHTNNNTVAFAFGSRIRDNNLEGICAFKRDFDSYLYSLDGFFDNNAFDLYELTYLPNNDASAYLFSIGYRCVYYTGATYWDTLISGAHPTKHFFTNYISQNSFCYCDLGYDLLSWSGTNCTTNQPPYLSHQKIGAPDDEIEHCQSLSTNYSAKANISIQNQHHDFKIQERYADNPINFEVKKIGFTPFQVDRETICIKEYKDEQP